MAGCLVERYRDDIRKDMPEVDAIIGTNELDRIVGLCEGWTDAAAAAPPEPYLYHDLTPRVLATPRHFAYIKIAEGCDHPCTFCVIPQYRGAFRSRRFESVVAEATRLFQQGVREINLIGQDTTCYGEDLGLKDGLPHLLARLARIETPREKWIRFLYAYPNKVTQKLLDTIAAHAALVKYIDMPLQHASAAVLKRMKRGGSGDIFLKLIERIRRTIPGVAIRTSMIVGFPGETDADFEELCQFVEAASFDHLGVFSYSDEDTSASYAAGRQGGRPHDLQPQAAPDGDRSARSPARATARWSGRKCRCWWKALARDGPALAGAHGDAGARDRRRSLINDVEGAPPAPGEIRRLRITEAHDYDLVGTLLPAAAEEAAPLPASPLVTISRSPTPIAHLPLMKCPICKKEVNRGDPEFPFCSERCRIIDLGNWASEKYVISTPANVRPKPRPDEDEPD